MWNKLIENFIHELSYKRLGLALCLSILLHILLFGGLEFSRSIFEKETHIIEARLQLPTALVKQVETKQTELKLPKQEKQVSVDQLVKKPMVEGVLEPLPPEFELQEYPPPAAEITPLPLEVPQEATEPLPQDVLSPASQGLIINKNPYEYVETFFDVRTKIDGPTQGKAQITYDVFQNNLLEGRQYHLKSLIEAKGIAAIFIPELLQRSEGLLTEEGLQPLSYLYQFGNKEDKTYKASFDWDKNTLLLNSSKGEKTFPLQKGAQDLLSFMYQFMHVAPLQNMQLYITNGKKLATYHYSFEGEEVINLPLGKLNTIHIQKKGDDYDEKTDLWLAIDYQFVPVKIRKTEKEGKLYELLATTINTSRPE